MSSARMLYLMTSPALEETLADWLLAHAPELGFTCVHVFDHGESVGAMSRAEQIAGRVKRVQFEIMCADRAGADDLLERLAAVFGGADIPYWLLPVEDHGRLGND